ncbi:hypothetical protein REC12_13910 [Desulfosporosinus sp. PR]|nr:hypothetical protein [Desulfosporosinus sp. PR]MDQ7094687.1 hypothetical protein [Desulfosporosinus sp. PR]
MGEIKQGITMKIGLGSRHIQAQAANTFSPQEAILRAIQYGIAIQ